MPLAGDDDSQMKQVLTKSPARDETLNNLSVPFAASIKLDFTENTEYSSWSK